MWILNTLLALDEIEQVVINTDARDIFLKHGVVDTDKIRIRDRRPELCGDDVSMNLVLADDIQNTNADTYLMTHTTNPLLSIDTIRLALARYGEAVSSGGSDSMFSVNRVQTRFYREDGSPVNHDPNDLIPTQQLEPWFEENSNLYIFNTQSFFKTNARIGEKPLMFEMAKIEAVDIDDQQDWRIAEALLTHEK